MKRNSNYLRFLLDAILVIGLVVVFSFAIRMFQNQGLPFSSMAGNPTAYPAPGSTALPATPQDISYPPPIEITATPIPTATPTPVIDANGWYVYKDEQAGFSFSYPRDAYISAGKEFITMQFHLPGVYGYQGMGIWVYPDPQDLPVEEIAKKLYEETSQKAAPTDFDAMAKPEPMTVAGYAATKMIIPSVVSEFLIFVPNGQNVLIFGPSHEAAVLYADPKAIELMNEILSTLKLTANLPTPTIQPQEN